MIGLKFSRSYATFLCALVFASSGSLHAAQTCDPRDFGAKGDGTTKDTTAIQGAIDACAGKGGGTVRLTAGTYLSATSRSNSTKAPRCWARPITPTIPQKSSSACPLCSRW